MSARLKDRRVTAQEVAKTAGVSISAVSRTFTTGASVSPKMRKKVLAAAKKLGYRPNMIARSLMTRRTELVGLLIGDFANPVYLQIIDLLTLKLQARNFRPLVLNFSHGGDANTALEMALQYQVDGIIVASSTVAPALAETYSDAGLPVVVLFGRGSEASPLTSVVVDNIAGGCAAADLLLDRGYRELGVIIGPEDSTPAQDRLAGFRSRLNGAPLRSASAHAYTYEEGVRAANALLADAPQLDAVFCASDVLAMAMVDVARQKGLAIPKEFGIVGFGDYTMANMISYQLTTIRQPYEQIVDAAIDLVVARMASPHMEPETRMLRCRLVERETVRRARI